MRSPLNTMSNAELIRHCKMLAVTTQSILDSTPDLHDGLRTVAQRHIDAIDSATDSRPSVVEGV